MHAVSERTLACQTFARSNLLAQLVVLKRVVILFGVCVQVRVAVLEQETKVDWDAAAQQLDLQSPLQIMDHVRLLTFICLVLQQIFLLDLKTAFVAFPDSHVVVCRR